MVIIRLHLEKSGTVYMPLPWMNMSYFIFKYIYHIICSLIIFKAHVKVLLSLETKVIKTQVLVTHYNLLSWFCLNTKVSMV